jgi:hypothetical protein
MTSILNSSFLNYGSIDFADETDYGDILDVLLKEI